MRYELNLSFSFVGGPHRRAKVARSNRNAMLSGDLISTECGLRTIKSRLMETDLYLNQVTGFTQRASNMPRVKWPSKPRGLLPPSRLVQLMIMSSSALLLFRFLYSKYLNATHFCPYISPSRWLPSFTKYCKLTGPKTICGLCGCRYCPTEMKLIYITRDFWLGPIWCPQIHYHFVL